MDGTDRTDQPDHELRLRARRAAEQAPLDEAGEGVSEGFEASERELIDHSSHGDEHGTTRIFREKRPEPIADRLQDGEADDVRRDDV